MEIEGIIPKNVLDDLCSRFIINVPEEERNDLIRICFQIESAHWFYLDFYSKNFPNKKTCEIKRFAQQIFNHIPFLYPYSNNVDKIIDNWKDYKFCVPTFGAILLNKELSHVLLVQSYGSRSSWGFPKGKINKDELPSQCAIREVYEETGLDISNLLDVDEYIEANVHDQILRLYIVSGIDNQEKFEPQTRGEIKAVDWFPVCDIPLTKKEAALKQLKIGTGANTFFLVAPFLRRLRQWVFEQNFPQSGKKKKPRNRHKSCGDIDSRDYPSSFVTMFSHMNNPPMSNSGHKQESYGGEYSDEYKTHCTQRTEDLREKANGSGENSVSKLVNDCLKMKLPEVDESPVSILRRGSNDSSQKNSNLIKTSESVDLTMQVAHENLSNPYKTNVDIVSTDSAFRKVEKSVKSVKRKRRHKNAKSTKGDDGRENESENNQIEAGTDCETQEEVLIEEKFVCSIPSWENFRFNIEAIVTSMEEAITMNGGLKKM